MDDGHLNKYTATCYNKAPSDNESTIRKSEIWQFPVLSIVIKLAAILNALEASFHGNRMLIGMLSKRVRNKPTERNLGFKTKSLTETTFSVALLTCKPSQHQSPQSMFLRYDSTLSYKHLWIGNRNDATFIIILLLICTFHAVLTKQLTTYRSYYYMFASRHSVEW